MHNSGIAILVVVANHNPGAAVLAIIGASLIHEDLATVAVGIAVSEGLVDGYIGLAAILVGVMIGDCGLYALGRLGARIRALGRFLDRKKIERASHWLNNRLLLGIFVIRFIPGLRLSGYTACGFFHVPFLRFLLGVVMAVSVWTTGLFYLALIFGALTQRMLGYWQWPAIMTAFIVPTILVSRLLRRRKVGTQSRPQA